MPATAVATETLTLRNLSNENITAPVAVWVGCLLQSMPPEWRDEVIQNVTDYLGQMAHQGVASRIVLPS